MAEFAIEIAGYRFGICSLFESTKEYCRRYWTEASPHMQITVQPSDLVFEQQMLEREAVEEGIRIRKFQDPFLERTAIQRAVAEYLFDRDILMLHGSTVAVDGRGYLFTAKCGTGKSTHTRLWCQAFQNRAKMVNDDKPFLQVSEEEIRVCGSPWSGKHGLDTNVTVPLAGICILERGLANWIEPCKPSAALPMLLHQSYRPLDKTKAAAWEALVGKLAERIPLWKMQCNKDVSAAHTAYEAMS